MKIMKNHSTYGLSYCGKETSNLSVVPMRYFQHHENFNGSGYPRALKKFKRFINMPRIVAIADVYDAITTERPYQKARTPYQAYEIMSSEAGIKFDINLLESFFDNLAIFTPGSLVLLSNGFYAIVTSISSGLQFHPTIKVIAKPNKEFVY